MGKVIVGTTMSLDGFISDRGGDIGRLYPDLAALRESKFLQDSIRDTGAVVMGRGACDLAQGDWTGYEYQVPIFVLTHHPPETPPKGQNEHLKIAFVTDGVASAVAQAKAAACERDVTVVGGASTAQQIINAGLMDVLIVGIVPILLGDGLRFFEHIDVNRIKLEQTAVYESSGRTDICYRVIKAG